LKKCIAFVLALFAISGLFAQQITVVVAPFEVKSGFSRDDAEAITELFLGELTKFNTVKVLDQSQSVFDKMISQMRFQASDWADDNKVAKFGKALSANVIVRGQMMKLGDMLIVVARIMDINTTQNLSSSRMELKNINEVIGKLPSFTKEIVSSLPKPPPQNPFIGRWVCNINRNAFPAPVIDSAQKRLNLTCILNIHANGTLTVERYDTAEGSMVVNRNVFGNITSTPTKIFTWDAGGGTGTYTWEFKDNKFLLHINLELRNVEYMFSSRMVASFELENPNSINSISGNLRSFWYELKESGKQTLERFRYDYDSFSK